MVCMSPLLIVIAAAAAGLVSIPRTWTPRERAVASEITVPAIIARVRFLAHDLLEGRGPGTRGEELAIAYVVSEFERMGLRPVDARGHVQRFEILGVRSELEGPAVFKGAKGSLTPAAPGQVVVFSGAQAEINEVKDAEVVFCGYGITAHEQKWDDFKGTDVRGKVLLVMNNDPENDPELFAGKRRLYYGRWVYKFEEAERRGAAALVLIHTDHSAAYPWPAVVSSWVRESFELPQRDQPHMAVKMWATEDTARAIAALGGADLDALRALAERRDFTPVPLRVRLSVKLRNTLRRVKTANVLGVLPGSDLAGQMVVLTAHHDHLGVRAPGSSGEDVIYNGARDNASGVSSMLAIAEAMTRARVRPRRSILFASVSLEESGLLGSAYLVAHPPVPTARLTAAFNLDVINTFGRTRDVQVIGLGKSTLDDVLEPIARAQGRHVVGDVQPDRGRFYRSDHFNLARAGVPAIDFGGGLDYVGREPGWGKAQREAFTAKRYHQPSDELDDTWNLEGAVDDLRMLATAMLRVADAAKGPEWTPGDEFEAARKQAQAAEKEP
jgi:Zn-dependent M28 family amino/carboxypeptidase